MNSTSTDRIEKSVLLSAPRSRVWRALTTAEEFGAWFGVRLSGGAFVPGAIVRAAQTTPGFGDVPFEVTIESVEPERFFSYRWHPYAVEPNVDYSAEPTTLVAFNLEEVPGGTLLTVTETGFDAIPIERRATAFESNTEGWAIQIRAIEEYVGAHR